MRKYIIKKSSRKGMGVFAIKPIKKGEHVIKSDLTRLKPHTVKEIEKHPQRESEHWDEVGRGKWVLDNSPYSYVNHSCNPTCATKYYTLKKKHLVALRDIKKGEELTVDYSTGAIYGFGKGGFITDGSSRMKCRCGSKLCRKYITGDFFKLPKKLQRKYYTYLPSTIKRRYKKRFDKLLGR